MSIKLVRVLKKKVQREGVFRELSGEQETVDVVEVITALAKTVAEMTFGADAALRQQILDHLMRENFAVRGGVCKRALEGHAALKR
jgi:hypothetical protein